MAVRWVGQKDNRGCGFACLAMLVGADYEVIRAEFAVRGKSGDGPGAGITFVDVDEYLVEHGYAIARKYLWQSRSDSPRVQRDPWPCEPWGMIHIAEVVVHEGAPCGHFVVLLAGGTVLDPLTPEPKRLSDYWRVYNVAAVVKVNP